MILPISKPKRVEKINILPEQRLCQHCGVSIAHRHWNAKYCETCAPLVMHEQTRASQKRIFGNAPAYKVTDEMCMLPYYISAFEFREYHVFYTKTPGVSVQPVTKEEARRHIRKIRNPNRP